MGKYKDATWYVEISSKLVNKYGDIPPPWIYAPNAHPYSITWRMGGGETHNMVLSEWLDQQSMSFDNRVKYLHKYPPPPRWYLWIIHFLWGVFINEDKQEYLPYFDKLEKLGFDKTSGFTEDFSNENLD